MYETDWELEDKSFKETIGLMILSSQNPVKLSAWRMYYVSHASFMEVYLFGYINNGLSFKTPCHPVTGGGLAA